jgi:hypothetical protein
MADQPIQRADRYRMLVDLRHLTEIIERRLVQLHQAIAATEKLRDRMLGLIAELEQDVSAGAAAPQTGDPPRNDRS